MVPADLSLGYHDEELSKPFIVQKIAAGVVNESLDQL